MSGVRVPPPASASGDITVPEDAGEAQDQVNEALEEIESESLEECRNAAEQLSGDAQDEALQTCETVFAERRPDRVIRPQPVDFQPSIGIGSAAWNPQATPVTVSASVA